MAKTQQVQNKKKKRKQNKFSAQVKNGLKTRFRVPLA
jgi:hypothetical protein